jgi:hypothetical protein
MEEGVKKQSKANRIDRIGMKCERELENYISKFLVRGWMVGNG